MEFYYYKTSIYEPTTVKKVRVIREMKTQIVLEDGTKAKKKSKDVNYFENRDEAIEYLLEKQEKIYFDLAFKAKEAKKKIEEIIALTE